MFLLAAFGYQAHYNFLDCMSFVFCILSNILFKFLLYQVCVNVGIDP